MTAPCLLCFGFGYTASFLGTRLQAQGWRVIGTTTDPEKRDFLNANGVETVLFDRTHAVPAALLKQATHILVSVPPDADGDAVFDMHGGDIAALKNLKWFGYLSSTAVYGNHDGGWVDEDTPPSPLGRSGATRNAAEEDWRDLFLDEGLPLHIFRLSGIYGPGRSAIDAVRTGTARRLNKPGHAFNRIHVEDIAQTLQASINKPNPGSIYNLADDMPSPSHEVIAFACNLIGKDVPPLIPFEETAVAPVVRGFYRDNKRVKNDKIKNELGVELMYPDYRAGLQSCLDVENEMAALLKFTCGGEVQG